MRALLGSIARKARERVSLCDARRTQLTLNSVGDGVLTANYAGLITFLNTVAEQLFGWTYAEGVGRHLLEVFQVIDATTRGRVVPRMESRVQSDRTTIVPSNRLLVRRDGHELPIEDHAAFIYDRTNQISGMVVVIHDPTEPRAYITSSDRARCPQSSTKWRAARQSAQTSNCPCADAEQTIGFRRAPIVAAPETTPTLAIPLCGAARPQLRDPAVLLQVLSPKTTHQVLRSATWTEVGSSLRATIGLRGSISRAAMLGMSCFWI